MKLRHTILPAIAGAALIVSTALSAQAVTGCNVLNSSSSQPGTSIVVWNSSGQFVRLYRGDSSVNWATVASKVQKFRIDPATGETGCNGKSQYSGNSYPYKQGVVYNMSQNNLSLVITISCTI